MCLVLGPGFLSVLVIRDRLNPRPQVCEALPDGRALELLDKGCPALPSALEDSAAHCTVCLQPLVALQLVRTYRAVMPSTGSASLLGGSASCRIAASPHAQRAGSSSGTFLGSSVRSRLRPEDGGCLGAVLLLPWRLLGMMTIAHDELWNRAQ
eukprot:SRR837773.26154.p1 GENE.SRR837773.26154~~SRR837773.26154.p1  ORF type:complete len:179 (+),score=20.82 SRR837773.26154:81-539(+)